MAPADGPTAVSPAGSGFTFGKAAPSWDSPFSEDAPLSSFGCSPADRAFAFSAAADSASSLGPRRAQPHPVASPPAETPSRRHKSSGVIQQPAAAAAAAAARSRQHSSSRPQSDESQSQPETPPAGSWAAAATEPGNVQPGMDAASYIAGERAALLRAFRESLPSQQALGSLTATSQANAAQLAEEAGRVRLLQSDTAELRATITGVSNRVHALETGRLLRLEQRIEDACAAGPSQEFRQTLSALQEVLAGLASQRGSSSGFYAAVPSATVSAAVASYFHGIVRGVWHAGCAAVGQADVAAVGIARRILLDEPASAPQQDLQPGKQQQGDAADPARAVLGAALLVAAVEAACAGQQRVAMLAPRPLNHAGAPLALGLRYARIAVWAAALTLTAVRVRQACFATADAIVGGVRRSGVSNIPHRLAAMATRSSIIGSSGASLKESSADDGAHFGGCKAAQLAIADMEAMAAELGETNFLARRDNGSGSDADSI